MDTGEPKTGAELSEEQSDLEGKEAEDAGPSLAITLLLTTGARHPFTIDGKYLRKQSVNVENYDPFAMSVYTLKELIWREWRSGKSAPLPAGGATYKLISNLFVVCRLGNPSIVPELNSFDFLRKIAG
jgi:hypothetical protein